MNNSISNGFFNVDILNKIATTKSLKEAKEIAYMAVELQPNARPDNIKKAREVIDRSKSTKSLLIALGNFMLSHPSENLGMSNIKR